MIEAIAPVLLLVGACFMLVGAIGIVRFHDVLARMHALSKASTLGLLLVLVGGAVALDDRNDVSFLVLAAIFQVLTAPVATYLLARATYRDAGTRTVVDDVDHLDEGPSTGG